MPAMCESVDKTIFRLNSELAAVREALKAAPFTDQDREPADVLYELDRLRSKVEGLRDQITTVQGCSTHHSSQCG